MSFLALNAAPLEVYDNTTSYINKKTNRTKTQKRHSFPDQIIDQDKVRQVLESIHGCTAANNRVEDDDNTELGDYNTESVYNNNSNSNNNSKVTDYKFPPPPISAGVGRATIKEWNTQQQSSQQPIQTKEGLTNLGSLPQLQQQNTLQSQPKNLQNTPGYNTEDNIDLNNYPSNYPSRITDQEYYKKFVANVTDEKNIEKPYLSTSSSTTMQSTEHNALLQKINYMIHLLEEQKDERTGSVAEEVVLYSFLGIFIIFLADTFSKIGKYKR